MYRLKKPFDRLPIVYKLGLLMIGLVCVTFLSLWVIIKSTLFSLLNEQIEIFGNTMANQTALAAVELILAEEMLALKTLTTQVSQAPNIVRVRIVNLANETLADSGARPTSEEEIPEKAEDAHTYQPGLSPNEVLYSADIVFQNVKAGEAHILIDNSSITAIIERTLSWMTLTFFFMLILVFPLSFFLARYWAEPIHRLKEATLAIHAGNLETRVHNERADEFGVLLDSFNEMAVSLKEREHLKDTVHRYIGSGVAQQLLVTPENPIVPLQPLKATIAFFDIVSFTRLCEKLSSDHIAELLNQYYTCIQYCCAAYGGFVDKYIGDGALVVFTRASSPNNDHATNALLAAHLFLRVAHHHISATVGFVMQKPLAYRIGFHTGEMLAGTLGDAERLQYTVIGDAVNVAARLCDQAPPNLPVFSGSSRERMALISDEYVEFSGRWHVRGRLKDIPVYASKSLPETLQHALSAQFNSVLEKIAPQTKNTPNFRGHTPQDMAQLASHTPSLVLEQHD